ncbi:hypothetical protein Q9189_002235 [Teloschistes chrysophthalmus]
MDPQESKLEEVRRSIAEQKARGEAAEVREARDAGFTNVEDFRDWELREERERRCDFEARMAEMERNGTVDPWLQKQMDDDLRHVNSKFCPGGLVSEPNSTTGSCDEFDRERQQEIWEMPFNWQGPSNRYEGSDVNSLWSLDSQEEQNREEMPEWADRDPFLQCLMKQAGRLPLGPHDHMFDGDHQDEDQDVEMIQDRILTDRGACLSDQWVEQERPPLLCQQCCYHQGKRGRRSLQDRLGYFGDPHIPFPDHGEKSKLGFSTLVRFGLIGPPRLR